METEKVSWYVSDILIGKNLNVVDYYFKVSYICLFGGMFVLKMQRCVAFYVAFA